MYPLVGKMLQHQLNIAEKMSLDHHHCEDWVIDLSILKCWKGLTKLPIDVAHHSITIVNSSNSSSTSISCWGYKLKSWQNYRELVNKSILFLNQFPVHPWTCDICKSLSFIIDHPFHFHLSLTSRLWTGCNHCKTFAFHSKNKVAFCHCVLFGYHWDLGLINNLAGWFGWLAL